MLVLSRRENENIVIGDDITITVVEIVAGQKVRLGISAPPDVVIHRQEVYDAIKAGAYDHMRANREARAGFGARDREREHDPRGAIRHVRP